MSKSELNRRKMLHKSANAEIAKAELNERDFTRAPSKDEIELELRRLQVSIQIKNKTLVPNFSEIVKKHFQKNNLFSKTYKIS